VLSTYSIGEGLLVESEVKVILAELLVLGLRVYLAPRVEHGRAVHYPLHILHTHQVVDAELLQLGLDVCAYQSPPTDERQDKWAHLLKERTSEVASLQKVRLLAVLGHDQGLAVHLNLNQGVQQSLTPRVHNYNPISICLSI
jgi:hypothetical protein